MDRLYNISPKTQDERIHDDVCRRLISQADIESREIVVGVKNTAVVLAGRVESCLERREAESAARAAYGVSSITNNIRVEPKRSRTDREIRDHVLACLRTSMCVLEELPSVSVCDGIVTLGGQARWKFQAVSAERAAEAVVGVQWVRNSIEVSAFETRRPRRQMNRYRLNDTPSSMNHAEQKSDSSCRPLFFVPSVIARA
jgi:osmotically-inducible protein OsmY